jgi:hypothetical protein
VIDVQRWHEAPLGGKCFLQGGRVFPKNALLAMPRVPSGVTRRAMIMMMMPQKALQ